MIRGYHPVIQALFGSLFTWGLTALGAAAVFLFTSHNKKLLDVSLGFAAGVMMAASFWSLLAPALEITSRDLGYMAFLPVCIGFAFGSLFVYIADKVLPVNDFQSQPVNQKEEISLPEGLRNRKKEKKTAPEPEQEETDDDPLCWHRIFLLIIAITVHNIPEGLAVGVGFGAVGKSASATFESAFNLALGIGIQNFPEGLAVSLPLSGFGYSKFTAFWYGQLSGMVEPISALIGALAVTWMEPVLPYALAFAAGAMIFVVVDDIIPEAQMHGNGKLASWGCVAGFIVMMTLDVALG